MLESVKILYRNWRGETAVREIIPGAPARAFWFGSTGWHPESQFFVTATDAEKQASRDFALAGILAWGEQAIAERATALAEARAEGRRQGLEEAARVADELVKERTVLAQRFRAESDPKPTAAAVMDGIADGARLTASYIRVAAELATAPAETQKPETGESE